MKKLYFIIVLIIIESLFSLVVRADNKDHWAEIALIMEKVTKGEPDSREILISHINSLTTDDLIEAIKMGSTNISTKYKPQTDKAWGEAGGSNIILLLNYYAEKLKENDDEYGINRLLEIVSDSKEDTYLRVAIIAMLGQGRAFPIRKYLNPKAQENISEIIKILNPLIDPASSEPYRLKREVLWCINDLLSQRYKTILENDPAIKEIRQNEKTKTRLEELLSTQPIELSPVTKSKQSEVKQLINQHVDLLNSILKDRNTSEDIRKTVKRNLELFNQLPAFNY